MERSIDSINEIDSTQSDSEKIDNIWDEISESLDIQTIEKDPWGLNEVQNESSVKSEEPEEKNLLVFGGEPQFQHVDDVENMTQTESIVGLGYRQRLNVDFQSMIDLAATLIVFAARSVVASIVSICIISFIITVYAAVLLLTVEIITRIYYFFNSDSQAAGIVGAVASFIGEKIIQLIGIIISLLGDFIQSFSSNIYCQGGLGFIILILGLSKWAKRAGSGVYNYTMKANEHIRNWWEWAYAPLYALGDDSDEEE